MNNSRETVVLIYQNDNLNIDTICVICKTILNIAIKQSSYLKRLKKDLLICEYIIFIFYYIFIMINNIYYIYII